MKKIEIKKPGVLFAVFLILMALALFWFFVEAEDFYTYTRNTLESAAQVAPVKKEDVLAQTRPPKNNFNTEV